MDEEVSVSCKAHNMELRTFWEAKMGKDKVSAACKAHNMELPTS